MAASKAGKMYTYKDFETGDIKRTRGEFLKWQRGGVLNAWGVVFKNPRSVLFVPEYLLTAETRERIPKRPGEGE